MTNYYLNWFLDNVNYFLNLRKKYWVKEAGVDVSAFQVSIPSSANVDDLEEAIGQQKKYTFSADLLSILLSENGVVEDEDKQVCELARGRTKANPIYFSRPSSIGKFHVTIVFIFLLYLVFIYCLYEPIILKCRMIVMVIIYVSILFLSWRNIFCLFIDYYSSHHFLLSSAFIYNLPYPVLFHHYYVHIPALYQILTTFPCNYCFVSINYW